MKKFFVILIISVFALPAFSACSIDIDKPCTATVIEDANSSFGNKHIPTPLDDIKKTDAFLHQYAHSHHENILNIDEQGYNSNCQFGICLPERVPEDVNSQY